MIRTSQVGVYYKESITNNKADKIYYITFKDEQRKKVWIKIGKYSEGFREAYCTQKRNEIITMQRNGEISPIAAKNKKKKSF